MKTIGLMAISAALWCVAIAGSAFLVSAQEQGSSGVAAQIAPAPAGQAKVFLFVQRTDQHVKHSSREVFENALNDLLEYLKGKNVAIAVDEFGGRNHAESATPMETVFNIARDAGANSVLYVVVDRPLTKWLKMTVECFDMSGKKLWQEEASSGGGLSGGHGFEVTTKKLHALLDKRIGQEGLPVLTAATGTAPQKQ